MLCSEIVEAFAAEVSGGLRKSLLERLEDFESLSTSAKDRCDSLRLCSHAVQSEPDQANPDQRDALPHNTVRT